jgi:hypothetical protein
MNPTALMKVILCILCPLMLFGQKSVGVLWYTPLNYTYTTIIGDGGMSTHSNQVVLAAGKDCQWRFNSDGTCILMTV